MIRIRAKQGVLPEYIYWCLQSQQFWQQVSIGLRGSAMANINGKMLASLRFSIPSLDLQEAIVLFLSGFREHLHDKKLSLPDLPPALAEQRRIDALAVRISEARGLRAQTVADVKIAWISLIQQVFNDGNYQEVILHDAADIICGQHLSPEEQSESGIPYITGPADFTEKVAQPSRFASVKKACSLPGDILLTVKGAGVGKINYAPSFEAVIGRQLFSIRFNSDLIDREFLYIILQYKLSNLLESITYTTVPGIGKDDVRLLKIPLPSLIEQQRIVAYMDTVQEKVDTLKAIQAATTAELDALLPSVLDQAFRGEL